MLRSILSLALALMLPAVAQATYVYTYTGNNFDTIADAMPPAGTYTTSMRLTVSFELAAPLPANMPDTQITFDVLSYSFNDGRNILTEPNSSADFFVSTDGSGDILTWNIFASALEGMAVGDQWIAPGSRFRGDAFDEDLASICETISGEPSCVSFPVAGGSYDRARIAQNPGTWTLVPEPGTGLLLGLGLTGIAAHRRRGPRA